MTAVSEQYSLLPQVLSPVPENPDSDYHCCFMLQDCVPPLSIRHLHTLWEDCLCTWGHCFDKLTTKIGKPLYSQQLLAQLPISKCLQSGPPCCRGPSEPPNFDILMTTIVFRLLLPPVLVNVKLQFHYIQIPGLFLPSCPCSFHSSPPCCRGPSETPKFDILMTTIVFCLQLPSVPVLPKLQLKNTQVQGSFPLKCPCSVQTDCL